ncbi:MAG: B12-binding domain-containing radical SAM protein [bacterium]
MIIINTNCMQPPIAPLGVDYIVTSLRQENIHVDLLDLCFADDQKKILHQAFSKSSPRLVALSFRNSDDSLWPRAQSFISDLTDTVTTIRKVTDAPILLGGVGFSLFPMQIMHKTGADFGIHGDGEQSIISLMRELDRTREFAHVPGLIWHEKGKILCNPPAWPKDIKIPTSRNGVDNLRYFMQGGQIGIETKRGCDQNCSYCADHAAKGKSIRFRNPAEVADEFESLVEQGIDVFHTCDCEFNISYEHALSVCDELIKRKLGQRIRWYAYCAVKPFDSVLAHKMAKAGCVGINFTGDSGSPTMLELYKQSHQPKDLAESVNLCKTHTIKVMVDLLLGGPGETPETLKETINFMKQINPDCIGASLGVRLYPGTMMTRLIYAEGPPESNPSIRRKYRGAIELYKPTFYISQLLGAHPAHLLHELVGNDTRFFKPALEGDYSLENQSQDYNYNDNNALIKAIASGSRGAYWDILHQLQNNE